MADRENEQWHPGVAQYVEVGVILAVITAIEVSLFYADLMPAITVPTLLILTVAKFSLVILWFMHLRFDHRLFRRVFFAGMGLALTVFGIVIWIMYVIRDPLPGGG